MSKSLKMILFFSIVVISAIFEAIDSSPVYPFVSHPELSWAEFEQNFRKKHNDIEIPQIVLDNQCDFAPMHIGDPQDPDLVKFNKNKAIAYEPPFIIMNTKSVLDRADQDCPAAVGWVLLHETGHYHYGLCKRQQNHARAKIIGDTVKIAGSCLLVAVTGKHIYKKFHAPFAIKQLILPALAAMIFMYRDNIVSAIDTISDDVIGTRPDEYAADAFANKHATEQELQAIKYIYSPDYFRDLIATDLISDIEKDSKLKPEVKESYIYLLNSKWPSLFVHHLTAIMISHPSHQIRYDMVCKALKDRFGVEVDNK